jgi:hypothetical protein
MGPNAAVAASDTSFADGTGSLTRRSTTRRPRMGYAATETARLCTLEEENRQFGQVLT